jgi:5-(carboxyamino)imidazole ribonucleotide synthase
LKSAKHKNNYNLGLKVGILGGGQLARMLALSGAARGLEVHSLSEHPTDPVAQVSHFWVQGSPESQADLISFSKNLDLLTFESEFFAAIKIEKALGRQKSKMFPSTRSMSIIQDRAKQKILLDDFKIPTSPFIVVHSSEDLVSSMKVFGPMVLKKRLGGYDGNGTWILRQPRDIEKIEKHLFISPGFIAEKFVPFQRELAVMLVRTRSGQKQALPLTQTVQKNSRCDYVLGPIYHSAFPRLQKKLFKMLDGIDYVGVLGVELFDTGRELLVNELAPRVHNSGHYSQNALSLSQFDLHWMAGLGMTLPKIQIQGKAFAMINLIGQKNTTQMKAPKDFLGQIHWYGKSESRPGRKMGHLNYTGSSTKSLLSLALKERNNFKL